MKRDPVPKAYARLLKPTLVFDRRNSDELDCLTWIRKAPHGEMTKRLMKLIILGWQKHKEDQTAKQKKD